MSDDTKSADAIEAEIEVTRARLASTVDELAARAKPKEILRRQTESLKARLAVQTDSAKTQLRDQVQVTRVKLKDAAFAPDGQPRTERLAAVGAAIAAVVVLLSLVVARRARS